MILTEAEKKKLSETVLSHVNYIKKGSVEVIVDEQLKWIDTVVHERERTICQALDRNIKA